MYVKKPGGNRETSTDASVVGRGDLIVLWTDVSVGQRKAEAQMPHRLILYDGNFSEIKPIREERKEGEEQLWFDWIKTWPWEYPEAIKFTRLDSVNIFHYKAEW